MEQGRMCARGVACSHGHMTPIDAGKYDRPLLTFSLGDISKKARDLERREMMRGEREARGLESLRSMIFDLSSNWRFGT